MRMLKVLSAVMREIRRNMMRRSEQLFLSFFQWQPPTTLFPNPFQSRDAEISESNAELAALQREAAELATELRVSKTEIYCALGKK